MHLQDAASCSNFAIAGFLFLQFAFTLAVASTACPFFALLKLFLAAVFMSYMFFSFLGIRKGWNWAGIRVCL